MSNELVSIIIVSAGRKDYLGGCLKSIEKQVYPNREVIIVDNLKDKLAYAQALNQGIAKSRGDFILCLNDDVVLSERFIEEAILGFGVDNRIGMVSGKILRWDKIHLDSTGLFLSLFRTAKERGYGFKDRGQFEAAEYIFGVNGAVGFYRRQMLDSIKIGGEYFDGDFKFFYEDLDIAWRAQNLGWKGYYMPKAIAYHLRGGTARQDRGIGKRCARHYLSNELHKELIKNRYLAIIKNESIGGFFLHLPFIVFYDLIVLMYILLFKLFYIDKLFSGSFQISSAFKKRSKIAKLILNKSYVIL